MAYYASYLYMPMMCDSHDVNMTSFMHILFTYFPHLGSEMCICKLHRRMHKEEPSRTIHNQSFCALARLGGKRSPRPRTKPNKLHEPETPKPSGGPQGHKGSAKLM